MYVRPRGRAVIVRVFLDDLLDDATTPNEDEFRWREPGELENEVSTFHRTEFLRQGSFVDTFAKEIDAIRCRYSDTGFTCDDVMDGLAVRAQCVEAIH